MICPKCGSDRAKRNGGGRIACPDCRQSSYVPPDSGALKPVPDGYVAKGTSTLYREDGSIAAQWVKTTRDMERLAEIQAAVIEAAMRDLPQVKPIKPRGNFRSDMLSAYVIGDPHVGMMAWAAECGADWDLAIAKGAHLAVVADLIDRAPVTERALIVNLGDLLHYDSMEAKTPRSGHMLDADGRYNKMLHVAAEIMVQTVESARRKHKTVHVVNAIGNHDETGSQAIALALSHRFHNDRRVVVDTGPAVFNWFRWGQNFIGIHHGHTCKPDKLPGVMATDRAKDWGECRHRFWWTGHVHHESVREYPGVTVESFGTLAEKDAYATAGGWRSRQGMAMIALHSTAGEVGRLRSNCEIAGFSLARAA